MKDLTISNIERQNVLNNRFAVSKVQEHLDIEGMLFEGEYRFTKKMVADFYQVDTSTIDRYLQSNSDELKHNGYILCKGKQLKEFKLEFAHLINEASKTTQLGLFNFRSFLNIGMLLTESEKAKKVRSLILDFVITTMSRPEKGLQKRVNLMQQTTNSDLSRHYLPRQLRHLILQEYLSGVKTARQLSEEHGIPMSTIHKMGQRWKAKNSCSFVSTPNPYPIMSRVTSEEASELLSENKALRRRLEEALLRLEGYEIMGDILQEEYGIDLLKKSAAGQSSVSKKDTQQ